MINRSIDQATLEKVVASLKNAPELVILRLNGNNLGPSAMAIIERLLTHEHCIISELSLHDNHIGDGIGRFAKVCHCIIDWLNDFNADSYNEQDSSFSYN